MTKEIKTRRQLEALIMQHAARSGKCDDLESVCITGKVPSSFGEWRLEAHRAKGKATALSPGCETELTKIVAQLQQRYCLEGE